MTNQLREQRRQDLRTKRKNSIQDRLAKQWWNTVKSTSPDIPNQDPSASKPWRNTVKGNSPDIPNQGPPVSQLPIRPVTPLPTYRQNPDPPVSQIPTWQTPRHQDPNKVYFPRPVTPVPPNLEQMRYDYAKLVDAYRPRPVTPAPTPPYPHTDLEQMRHAYGALVNAYREQLLNKYRRGW